jgi:hypothetical protein
MLLIQIKGHIRLVNLTCTGITLPLFKINKPAGLRIMNVELEASFSLGNQISFSRNMLINSSKYIRQRDRRILYTDAIILWVA